jgi:tight adherence protein C
MLFLAVAALVASVYFLLSALTAEQRQVAVSLRRATRYGVRSQREIEVGRSVNERLLSPFAGRLARLGMRLSPKATPDAIRSRLIAAGLARTFTPQGYLALKGGAVAAAAAMALLAVSMGGSSPMMSLLLAAALGVLGFKAPDFYIESRARSRKDQMQRELPDVLDLLCVSVEAGLGFDQALVKLSERMSGPLVEEFALVLHEMRIGQTRSAALKHLSERLELPEISQFTRALIQADQLGIALSRILKVQSQDMRVRRQLAAEEKAMKAPVKMLFPTVIFIFPSLFVVALGPAVVGLMKSFSGGH